MEEIKVGEYIRDCVSGEIGKVVEVNPNYYRKEDDFKIWRASYKKIKHSPNILNILEIGDYVNGEQIMCFRNADCDYDIGTEYNDEFDCYYGYDKEQIKDIVTHEQFERMKYIVGDESNNVNKGVD